MSRTVCNLTVTLLSDAIFSSGISIPGGEDISLRLDGRGVPLIPGSTWKGLLRESTENLLVWKKSGEENLLTELFGQEGCGSEESGRRIIFGDLRAEVDPQRPDSWSHTRSFTAMEDGMIKAGTLRMAVCLNRNVVFRGILICDSADLSLLCDACRAIHWVGLLRNRGFGHVRAQLKPAGTAAGFTLKSAGCIRYRLRTMTPLAVSWLSRSGAGAQETRNYTEGREYLPGSAMRGMVLSALSQNAPEAFRANYAALLQGTRFLSAFPMAGGTAQMPTPAGFYSDKAGTRFYSVLQQDVLPGDKRAPLGRFCRIDGNRLLHSHTEMVTLQRIHRAQREMFTVRAIAPDTVLEGYIFLDDPNLAPMIAEAFSEYIWLGADRYSGSGLCRVELLDAAEPCAAGYGPEDRIPETLYMLLCAPMTMTFMGESVGIREELLARALGVTGVRIESCAASVTESGGFNRTLGCREKSEVMYEMGSVFCLRCSEAPTWEALNAVQRSGIGIRCQEGFGQVRFLKDFEAITAGQAQELSVQEELTAAVQRRARTRWLMETPLVTGLSFSQLGNIQALCQKGDVQELDVFLRHGAEERRSSSAMQHSYAETYALLKAIWSAPLEQTLSCPGYPDSMSARLELISDWLRLDRKEG